MSEQGIRFAEVGTARVAYQTHGGGDLDIVYSPGLASHLDLTLEQPRYRRYVDELARFGRVIRFDRRGAGISDPLSDPGESWEDWAADLAAVLDDMGSKRAAIIATNDAGAPALLFAAARPERMHALVLFNTTARFTAAADYPEGHPPETADFIVAAVRETWGTEASADLLAPSLAADQPFRAWYARFQRAACSPTVMADNLSRLFRMDARHVLSEVQCPTLVLQRSGYAVIGLAHGRYLAAHIPGATFEEVPGGDAPIYTEGMKPLVDRIGRFLGRAPAAPPDERTFATVVFTDIVGSTEKAAALGDARWHEVLVAHEVASREAVGRHSGRFIQTTGDGMLAAFDGPTRALRCAVAIREQARPLGIEVRVGLHAGPVILRDDGEIRGLAVHLAARVLGRAQAGEILASGSVVDLVTDETIRFEDRGTHELKGIPEPQRLYATSFVAAP